MNFVKQRIENKIKSNMADVPALPTKKSKIAIVVNFNFGCLGTKLMLEIYLGMLVFILPCAFA